MNSSRIVLANLTNPHANNNNGMLARLKQKLESRSVTNPISNLTAPIESAKPKKPEQHPKLSADPCVRLHSATNRTLAVQSAAIAIADGQSVLPEFIPSVDRDRLVKDMHKLQETLKYVNYTVYYKVPRPSYNESRDLLIELTEVSRTLNFFLCNSDEQQENLGTYYWLYEQLYFRRQQFNASLPVELVTALHQHGVNMSILANGRAISSAKEIYTRIGDILKQLKNRCQVIECASTINYSLYPPRIKTLPWLYQQLNYTAKILNASLPSNLTEPLIAYQADLDFKWNAEALFDPAADNHRSWAIEHLVNKINNCNSMQCINAISLASVRTTPYDYKYSSGNNNVIFMESDVCATGLLCAMENQSKAFAFVIFLLLLALCSQYRSVPFNAASKALSNTLPANVISKAIRSGTMLISRLNHKAVKSDDEEMGLSSTHQKKIARLTQR
jgi:hypothetical protein